MKMVLRKNGEVVPLTPTELKIAAKLMAAPGRVYTKPSSTPASAGRSMRAMRTP